MARLWRWADRVDGGGWRFRYLDSSNCYRLSFSADGLQPPAGIHSPVLAAHTLSTCSQSRPGAGILGSLTLPYLHKFAWLMGVCYWSLLADTVDSSLSAAGGLGLPWALLHSCTAQPSKIGTDGNFDAPQSLSSYAGLKLHQYQIIP